MKKVLLGLDLGTDSVGWCATDENGQIIKKNGKSLWGYHGFDEASDASSRRANRCNRRRLNRRNERIDLLREIFKDEINKVDSTFFYRLDNSFYDNKDREHPFNYTLFNDINYTDKDFYNEYPTIYHLRKELFEKDEKADIRKLYLALHHMIKYRGNFLSSQEDFVDNNDELDVYFKTIDGHLGDIAKINISKEKIDELNKINEKKLFLKILKEEYNKVLNENNNKYLKNVIIPLMVGSNVNIKNFGLEEIDELKEIKVNADNFEETVKKVEESISTNEDTPCGEDLAEILINCKSIYDYFLLMRLLGKNKSGKINSSISTAMVTRYEKHHKELEELKKYVKENLKDKYDEIFRTLTDDKDANNYARYIGSTIYIPYEKDSIENSEKPIKKREKHCSKEDFYKFLKKELGIDKLEEKDLIEGDYLSNVWKEISLGTYLERQNGRENSVFPYQLNKLEMKKILEIQSKYYEFLNEKEDGLTNKDKIISILEYKIPYYVGPLISPKEDENGNKNERSKFAWVARTEEKIYPWNFDKVVDTVASANNFITKMLTKCTYLKKCWCLPKQSIIFSYYNVLSHLNKLTVNGKYLNKDEKLKLIDELYKKEKNITKKKLKEYFIGVYNESNIEIKLANGGNEENSKYDFNMGSYVDFTKIFGADYLKSKNNIETIEKIIRDIVIFTDKKILEKRLKLEYNLSDEVIKSIKGLNYAKFASLSKEFLTEVITTNDGQITRIIDIIEDTNMNLQEIFASEIYKEGIDELIKKYSVDTNETIEDYVADLGFVSPGMKRPMIRAYKIIEEVEKILNHPIDEYYVECTRTNKDKNKGKNTKTRKEVILDFYKQLLKDKKDNGKEYYNIRELNEKANGIEPSNFKSDKLYLYFSQLGRCMYSGEIINFDDLMDDSKYDIDHIYPQSLIKDDSLLNNRVLVKQDLNKRKTNIYPIPEEILFNGDRNKACKFYKFLKENNFINEEKYYRLTGKELNDKDFENFANRQLVYTSQAVKGLIGAIKTLKKINGKEPKVVFSKGENVSEFRQKFNIFKSRNVNNFHHAHDAYLNIMVGRAIDSYFDFYKRKYRKQNMAITDWATMKNMHDEGISTNLMNIFCQNKNNSKPDIYDKDKNICWSYDSTLKEIKHNIFERFDIFSTERTYMGNDLFGKITIEPHDGDSNIPVSYKYRLDDVEKYGGFKQYSFGSYCLINYENKNKLIAIPTAIKKSSEKINNHILNNINKKEYKVILDNIHCNTVIEKDNRKFVITGITNNSYYIKNKYERIFSKEEIIIIKKIEKIMEKIGSDNVDKKSEELGGLDKYLREKGMYYKDRDSLVIYYSKNKEDLNKNIEYNLNIITNKELSYIYDSFIRMLGKKIYSYSSSISIKKLLEEKKQKFNNDLSMINKCKLIFNLLDFLKCNEKSSIDLTLIDGKKTAGILTMSSDMTNCKIVYESITGFYRKEFLIN